MTGILRFKQEDLVAVEEFLSSVSRKSGGAMAAVQARTHRFEDIYISKEGVRTMASCAKIDKSKEERENMWYIAVTDHTELVHPLLIEGGVDKDRIVTLPHGDLKGVERTHDPQREIRLRQQQEEDVKDKRKKIKASVVFAIREIILLSQVDTISITPYSTFGSSAAAIRHPDLPLPYYVEYSNMPGLLGYYHCSKVATLEPPCHVCVVDHPFAFDAAPKSFVRKHYDSADGKDQSAEKEQCLRSIDRVRRHTQAVFTPPSNYPVRDALASAANTVLFILTRRILSPLVSRIRRLGVLTPSLISLCILVLGVRVYRTRSRHTSPLPSFSSLFSRFRLRSSEITPRALDV